MVQKALQLKWVTSTGLLHPYTCLTAQLGYFKLEEDDILFVRASTASPSGMDDVAVCWITGGCVVHPERRGIH